MQVSEFEKELAIFKADPIFKNFQWTQIPQVDTWYANLPEEAKRKALLHQNEDTLKRNFILSADMKLASKSGLLEKLSPEKQAEFNKMMVDYYNYNESIGLGEQLKEIWGDLYDKVKNMVVTYGEKSSTSPMDTMKDDIIKNENVEGYFTEHMKDELVPEEKKTDAYYQ